MTALASGELLAEGARFSESISYLAQTTFVPKAFTECVTCTSASYAQAAIAPNVTIFQFASVARSPLLAICSSTGAVGSIGWIESSVSATMER